MVLLELPKRWPKPGPQGRASKHSHSAGLPFPVSFNSCQGGDDHVFSVPSLLGSIQGNLESQMLQLLDRFHGFFRAGEVKANLLDEMDQGKWLKPRLCSHHMRMKHLSVSTHIYIAKSCPSLDWSRASLLLRALSRQVCSSTHLLQCAGHPWVSRYFPSCADGWE